MRWPHELRLEHDLDVITDPERTARRGQSGAHTELRPAQRSLRRKADARARLHRMRRVAAVVPRVEDQRLRHAVHREVAVDTECVRIPHFDAAGAESDL